MAKLKREEPISSERAGPFPPLVTKAQLFPQDILANNYPIANRANLEINYAKGLQKLATKLSKALQSTKKNCLVSAWAWVSEGMKSTADLHQKLGKAIELEAIKPTHQVLSVHEKKRKSLLNKLKKSTEKLAKEDENYYQKNVASCSTRLKWENTLENCFQSILELEKERIQLLCNNLNQYSQHISGFGQTLSTCHMQIHCAISKIDVEKDIQALIEKTAISSAENKSEFLLTDYFVDPVVTYRKKYICKQTSPEKPSEVVDWTGGAVSDGTISLTGLERMLRAYTSHSSSSDTENQKSTAALMDENSLVRELVRSAP
ncbi:nostrin [Camelus ferus]|nr:nostrin [Camelus ferus]